MFNSKKTSLFSINKRTSAKTNTNPFVKAGYKEQAKVKSGNGSAKFDSSGNIFVDQFNMVSQYLAPRPFSEIAKDMQTLYINNALLCITFAFYIRMITRKVSFFDGTKTEEIQKGAGLKNEGRYRAMWIAINHPDVFWKNISIFISIGGWKDVFFMLSEDLQFHGWEGRKLDWSKFGLLIKVGLENPATSELIKKYLPAIKAESKCKTVQSQANCMIGKWLCSILYGSKMDNYRTYKQYRKLKSSGTAHQWQQLISKKLFNEIDFNSIHGRALMKLVSSKFLKKNGLSEKYSAWIASKPAAKFTGYLYELAKNIDYTNSDNEIVTINKQYETLKQLAMVNLEESPFKAISVVDTSGSMNSMMYIGNGKVGNMRSIEVAKANTILLDDMLPESPFKGNYLEFSRKCVMQPIVGENFVGKYSNFRRSGCGGTNFMSVFDLFIQIKQDNPTMHESLFPNMIVVFSDGEFDNVGSSITNVRVGRQKLVEAGFSREFSSSFGFCFVDMPNTFYSHRNNRKPKFETFGDVKNVFYFSGYDLAPLGFLFGQSKASSEGIPTTAVELFDAAMNQEVLSIIQL